MILLFLQFDTYKYDEDDEEEKGEECQRLLWYDKEGANDDEGNYNFTYVIDIYSNHIHTYNNLNILQYLPIAILSRAMSMYNLHQ